jgi:hypothetical protein
MSVFSALSSISPLHSSDSVHAGGKKAISFAHHREKKASLLILFLENSALAIKQQEKTSLSSTH